MANAKQYNDLNTTSTVNSTDKVALAQADKTELVTTTVSDLANAVGELNQAGALAELSLATSMGKNLLAQRLNEKGATDITPNNTLIEMADAVDELPIYGSILSDKLLPTKVTTNVTPPNYIKLLNNNLFIVANGKLYFVPDGAYSNQNEMISAAKYSIDLQNASCSLYARSSNESYVAVQDGTATSNNVYIYHNTGSSFELTATFNPQQANCSATGISDDGNIVVFSIFGSSTQPYMYNITKSYWGTFPVLAIMQGTYVAIWDNNIFVRYAEYTNTSDLNQYQPLLWYSFTENEDGSLTTTLLARVVPNTTTAGDYYYINNKHYFIYTTGYTPYVSSYKYYTNYLGEEYKVTLVELETRKELVFPLRTVNLYPATYDSSGTELVDSNIIYKLEMHYENGQIKIKSFNTIEDSIVIDAESFKIVSKNDYLTSLETVFLPGAAFYSTSYSRFFKSLMCSAKGYYILNVGIPGSSTWWYSFSKGFLGFAANMQSGKILYPITNNTQKTWIINESDIIKSKQVEIK